MDNITPGYYWARQYGKEYSNIIIIEIDDEWPWIYLMGTDELFDLDAFEFIQRIELPEFILDKLDERDYEDNKRPTPSLQ